MRRFVGAAAALVVVIAAYWGWALVGAAQLATAAAHGDAAALTPRIDLPALRRSLGGQIVRAYLRQNPRYARLGPLERGLAGSVGGSVADAMLQQALTPESIGRLLSEGRVGASGAPDAGDLWRMPPLGDAFVAGPLRAALNSYFDGPIGFVVALEGVEGRYGVHLRLAGGTWRLSGLDIPEPVSERLARAIAQKEKGEG
jgi:Protein of unknown function (DUF2939)